MDGNRVYFIINENGCAYTGADRIMERKNDMKVKKFLYGGDYNPEQWPEEVWEADMKLLKEAHINELTLNVFSWAALQPSEDTYDFSKLDKIMEMVRDNGFKVMLATSTAATPPWMAKRHPDILRTDGNGMKRKYGARHNFCPSSPTMRKYAPLLAQKLAERYKDFDNIVAWHIGNEYGGECHCDNCQKNFREWLKKKYGTLDELNRAWNTSFWSHTYYDWDEIMIPDERNENFVSEGGKQITQVQGAFVDYKRFNSDIMLEEYRLERDVIKKVTPDIPITTNFMWFFYGLNYRDWAKYMDFISWDCYPHMDTEPAEMAMAHDLIRGVAGQKPFALMESSPSVTNWQHINPMKRPGQMTLINLEAVAHGADTVQFFQMRRARGAAEAMHGSVIEQVGLGGTRVYNEVKALGERLEGMSDILGSTVPSECAIVFDWENWWAVDALQGPTELLDYQKECLNYYRAFFDLHIPVDVIGTDDDLSKYKVVVAPMLFMASEDYAKKIEDFVKNGGTFIASALSGYVDKDYLFYQGGYPGPFKEVFGLWVEEQDALAPDKPDHFEWNGKEYEARLICDQIRPLSELKDLIAENKKVLGDLKYFDDPAYQISAEAGDMTVDGTYTDDFYKGTPVITENVYGDGHTYYVGTQSSPEFYRDFMEQVTERASVKPVAADAGDGVEVAVRENENGRFLFYLDHKNYKVEIKKA